MTIAVKGMVCNRCIITIKNSLEKMGVLIKKIELGKVEVYKTPELDPGKVQDTISSLGFEILVDKNEKLVETVKTIINDALSANSYPAIRFSLLISDKTRSSYERVSSIFSAREGVTLEHYIINQKIERVKHMLTETTLSLTDISYQTSYSSVHHLSKQFKEKLGLNPSEYRIQSKTNLQMTHRKII